MDNGVRSYRKPMRIAMMTAIIGAVIVIIMPLFSIPFTMPYPRWAISPMELVIFMFIVSVLVFLIGVPASIIAINNKGGRNAWLILIGCLATYPLGIVATLFVAYIFNVKINLY